MQRKFFTNLILLLFLNLLIKPFWFFGIEVGVQKAVGESAYGFYFVILNLTMVMNILLDLGITNYNNKNIAQHQFLLQKHLGNIISIRFILAIFYSIVVFSIAIILGYDSYKIYILSILVLNQFLSSFILYLRSNLSGLHLFRTDSFISVLDKLLMIGILSVLLWGNVTTEAFRIEWFVYAQTLAFFITFLITLIAVLNKSGRIKIHFDYKFFIAFFKQSYPYALLVFLMAFYNRFDSVMIDALLPKHISKDVPEIATGHYQVGVYAQAYRILDVASQFGYLFAALLLPIFSRMIKRNENIGQILQLSYSLIIVPAIIIAVTASVFASELMNLLYVNGTEFSTPIFSVIILGFISISTTYIFGTLLTANGNLKQLNIMALIGITSNLSLNFILIPSLKAEGAAYSSLITQSITALAQVLIAWRIFKLKFNYFFILKIFVLGITSFFFANYFQSQLENQWIAIASTIGVSLLFSFLVKLLNLKDLFFILKDNRQE